MIKEGYKIYIGKFVFFYLFLNLDNDNEIF